MSKWLPLYTVPFGLLALAVAAGAAPRRPATKPGPSKAAAPKVVRLEATPAAVRLLGPRATQRLLVTAYLADGTRRDVTDAATFTTSAPKIAGVSPKGEITAREDGEAAIAAAWGGQKVRVAVQAQGVRRPIAYSFIDDVVPTLARLGCSQGACHGAEQGKGGFKLSLRGYAPERDFVTITRQLGGRRISREAPEKSLLLRKPLLEIAHRGGRVLAKGSREHEVLRGWLRQGAPGPTGKEAALTRLDVLPGDRTMRVGERQRLLVRATYADGRTEDVTGLARFQSNDVAVVTVDDSGQVTQQRPGETAVLAQFRDRLAAARFLAPFPQAVSEAAFQHRNNFVDDHVHAKLRQLRIEPSRLCTDQEFLRRAHIDALGTLPTEAEARAFLDSRDPKKRERLVDALLRRPEFGMVWALKFGDLFVLRREYLQRKNAMLFQQWLMEQFNANRPWNRIVTDILTATGDPDANRAALFFISRVPHKGSERYWIRHPEATAEMAAQVFLGNRIGCAKCHNHPTEQTTQDDYYRFVALFQQVTGTGTRDGVIPEKIEGTGSGDVRQPRTGALMTPQPLDRTKLTFAKDEDRRVQTAAWMVRQEDFVKNIVNRFWARCFGAGIIEPVDDIRSTNPARNEPLMQALCRDFIAHGYDLKHLMATIMKSRTYQLSAEPNRTNRVDDRLFSHYPARRLPAEEMADAVAQVTGIPDRYPGMVYGARALELADAEIPSLTLDTFGRPPRVMPTDSERNCSPAISQALALLNGDALQQKLKAPDGVLPALLKSGKTDAQILESLFLRALARRPTPPESTALLDAIKKSTSREEALQDVLWALLNSKEFLFNH